MGIIITRRNASTRTAKKGIESMRNSIFFCVRFAAFVIIALVGIPQTASAGFMDKLNAATEKMNQATQKIQTGGKTQPAEDPDRPLHLEDHYKGSCEGKRSAT